MFKFHISLPTDNSPELQNLISAIQAFFADEPIHIAQALEISTPSAQVANVLKALFPGARTDQAPAAANAAAPETPARRGRKPRQKRTSEPTAPAISEQTANAMALTPALSEHLESQRRKNQATGSLNPMSLVDPPKPAGPTVIIDDRPADVLRTIKRHGAIGATKL